MLVNIELKTIPNQWFQNQGINFSLLCTQLQETLNRPPIYSFPRFLTSNIASEGPYITRAKGVWLYCHEGREILDLASNTVNCSLGQNDPWVKANLLAYQQSEMPSFLSTRLKSPIYCTYPERLTRLGIGGIENPRINHRQCNGSDVTELALKAASMRAGRRKKVVSFTGSYHGQNLTCYFVSEKQKGLRFLCDRAYVEFLPVPQHQPEDTTPHLALVDKETLAYLKTISQEVFAVILEPIQMNNGVVCISPAFLQELKLVCEENDICLIYDEIQTGFGWMGALTAAEAYGVSPDILCLSKGVTAGYGPMAVMVAKEEYSELPYGSGEKTNGADIRALIAANAVLDRLIGVEDKSLLAGVNGTLAMELGLGLLSQVKEKAEGLRFLLRKLQHDYPRIVEDIRQRELIAGVKIKTIKGRDIVHEMMNASIEYGILVRNTGNWLIIKPPIVISADEMQEGFKRLEKLFISLNAA